MATGREPTTPAHRPPTAVRRKPSLDFSVTGLVYCSMMMFMGLAAINSQANLLFGVFGLMIGILLISGVISRMVLRKMRVRRDLPEAASVGELATITYHFTNHKKFWPSISVALGELDGVEAFEKQPFSYLLHAAGGRTADVPTEVVPKRRGLHQLDRYQVSTSFPFGFVKRAIERRHADQFLVYPPIARVDNRLIQLARSAEKTGATMRPRRGGNDEFYGVKEYRAGENPRLIYWRRSARTGVLVSKEMTQVSPPRLVLLVDTYLTDRSAEAHAGVEKAIAMAASLASHALEQGVSVGLVAWTDGGWSAVPPNRGKRQRRDLLSALARLPLNTSHPTQALLDEARDALAGGATAVLFTPRDLQLGLADRGRGAMVVVSVNSPQAAGWFRFAPTVDFTTVMPPEQQPELREAVASG
ncbi:MAG TPA: DUF58 domain-containing protein [Tepidisphaeraceae bacterium]|nr:DUF58 domain-containing protein [Tepidisphaeraceae bacterium]